MTERLRKKIFWSIECSTLAVLFLILASYNAVQYARNEQEDWHLLFMVMDASFPSMDASSGEDRDHTDDGEETGKDGAAADGREAAGKDGAAADSREAAGKDGAAADGREAYGKENDISDGGRDLEKGKWWRWLFEIGEPDKIGGDRPPREENGMRDKGDRRTTQIARDLLSGRIGLAELGADGSAESVSGFLEAYEEADREALIARILTKNKEKGRAGGMKYLRRASDAGSYVVILNAGYLNEDEVSLLLFSMLGLALAGGIFALIARRLAASIVRPVEETMTSRKQFIADASHELKTPVAVMMANIAVLEKEIGQNKWMDYIKEEGKRMSDLTSSLLLLSKLDYEQEEIGTGQRDSVFDLSDAVLETALPFESVAFELGIRYELEAGEQISARGNSEEIKQIVGILTDNAIKHAEPEGRVELVVQRKERRSGRKTARYAAVRVANTGEEIPADALPYIFDRFYKADTARAYRENSFGLGLAIAKSLAEKNGGEIAVRSEDGVTEFTLLLREADSASQLAHAYIRSSL